MTYPLKPSDHLPDVLQSDVRLPFVHRFGDCRSSNQRRRLRPWPPRRTMVRCLFRRHDWLVGGHATVALQQGRSQHAATVWMTDRHWPFLRAAVGTSRGQPGSGRRQFLPAEALMKVRSHAPGTAARQSGIRGRSSNLGHGCKRCDDLQQARRQAIASSNSALLAARIWPLVVPNPALSLPGGSHLQTAATGGLMFAHARSPSIPRFGPGCIRHRRPLRMQSRTGGDFAATGRRCLDLLGAAVSLSSELTDALAALAGNRCAYSCLRCYRSVARGPTNLR